jgi:translocation and assembly module TamB
MMVNSILKFLANVVSRFSKLLVWGVSFIFLIVILIQVGIVAGVFWLNSDNGQAYIKVQVAQATQSTGYNVDFEKVSYAFPQGLGIEGLKLSDAGGLISDMDRVIFRPNLIGLSVRHFGLSMNVDSLTLYRLPDAKPEQAPATEPLALQPFSLPDLYFRSLALNGLNIDTLDIKEAVFGTALRLSPTLTSKITLGDIIGMDLHLKVQNEGVQPPWMPRAISLQGDLNPQSLEMHLNKLVMRNESMNISAQGEANLSAQGRINITAQASVADFSPFAKGVEGGAEMEAVLNGSLNALAASATVKVAMPLLQERGLSDVTLNISDDNLAAAPLGHAVIEARYQDKPIHLSAAFNKVENIISIQSINAHAPDLALNGEVQLNTQTALVSGNIEINAPKMSTYSQMAGVNINGEMVANVTLLSDKGVQGAAVKANIANASYDEITLKNADLSAQLSDVQNPWPDALTLRASELRPANDVVIKTLTSTLTQKDGDLYALALNASGSAAQNFKITGAAQIKGLKQAQISAENIDFTLSSKGSSMAVRGRADMAALDMTLQTSNFNLGSLPVSLPEQMRDLALDAQAQISGPMSLPVIAVKAELTPITVIKGARIKISAEGLYDNNLARLDVSGRGDTVETLNGYAQLSLKFSLNPFVFDMPQSTPLEGRLNISAEARAFAPLLLPVGHKLTGGVNLTGHLAGTVGRPDLTGRADFVNGTYSFASLGLELIDMNMKADLTPEAVHVAALTAADGQSGKLSADGRVSFSDQSKTKLNLKLKDFKLLNSRDVEGTISADLNLQGRTQGYLVSGMVDLGVFDIIIPERFQSKIPQLNVVKKSDLAKSKDQLRDIQLDLKVTANERIFVRGWGLDAEFGGKITVDGTLDDPQLNGEMESKRGRYEEFGRRFDVERAYLRFQGSAPPSPYLDIIASMDAGDIKASVNLGGAVGNPSIKLSSVPALPEDEVMSRILFGENLTKITAFQAIQLKQTLDRFTGKGGGGFNPLGRLRDITGLDDIRIDSDGEGETSVGVGKYLTEGVYLELEKGAGDGSGTAKIQVEVTPSINVESEVGQDAQAGAGVLWKWDY